MYQFRLGKIGKTPESTPRLEMATDRRPLSRSKANWLASNALGIALLGIASASILIAIAETELQPNAITCDRLLITAIAF